MYKPLIDSYDEFNFMVIAIFVIFMILMLIAIVIFNFKNRSGANIYQQTTYNNNNNIISDNSPQTTTYQYNYTEQLNQYNLPTQGFY